MDQPKVCGSLDCESSSRDWIPTFKSTERMQKYNSWSNAVEKCKATFDREIDSLIIFYIIPIYAVYLNIQHGRDQKSRDCRRM